MKVLHVYRTYYPDPPGGIQEAIRQICLNTKPYGIENTIFALSPHPFPNSMCRDEGAVVRARSWLAPASCDIGGVGAVTTFRSLVQQADVVHYLFPWPFADLLYHAFGKGKPSVLTYISDVVRQRSLNAIYSPLMWQTLKNMRSIVFNAPSYANSSPILSDSRLQNRLRHIPLGIDEASCKNQGDDSIFERLGINILSPYFLFVGVLRYYKGVHFLIEAAAKVNVPIIIAGSGPMEESLKHHAKALGIPNIIFTGQLSDGEKNSLLKRCKALILPSHLRSEAYGMVLVEAAIYGRPLISCEIRTGTSYINAHNETGFVVPPEDPIALGAAMNRLLNQDELAEKFGLAARKRYEDIFSGEVMGRAYASIFREFSTQK